MPFQNLRDQARSLAQEIPYRPTQNAGRLDWEKVNQMVIDMKAGADIFWQKIIDSGRLIRVGPSGELVEGHHRVLAATLADVPIPKEAILTDVDVGALDPRPWSHVLK